MLKRPAEPHNLLYFQVRGTFSEECRASSYNCGVSSPTDPGSSLLLGSVQGRTASLSCFMPDASKALVILCLISSHDNSGKLVLQIPFSNWKTEAQGPDGSGSC